MTPDSLFSSAHTLGDPLPPDPLAVWKQWFDEAHARRVQPNPDAFALATVEPGGAPAVRMVLCRGMNLAPDAGYIVFFTNYDSRKGRALSSNPRAAALFHWDVLDRQVRIEGPVVRSPSEESDAYFASRPVESRIAAWASRQSEPIESREALLMQAMDVIRRLNLDLDRLEGSHIPRPPNWGGFRLWAETVELWLSAPGRLHDRARWTRSLTSRSHGFVPGPWLATRLQP